jgi:hypothetical protein
MSLLPELICSDIRVSLAFYRLSDSGFATSDRPNGSPISNVMARSSCSNSR